MLTLLSWLDYSLPHQAFSFFRPVMVLTLLIITEMKWQPLCLQSVHCWSHTELSIFPLYLLGIIAIHRFAPLGKPGYNTWVACEQWWTCHSVSHRLQTMTTAQSRWEKSSQTNFFTKAIYLIKAVFMSAQQEINVSSSDTRVKVFQCILTHPRLLSLSLCACYTHTHTSNSETGHWQRM